MESAQFSRKSPQRFSDKLVLNYISLTAPLSSPLDLCTKRPPLSSSSLPKKSHIWSPAASCEEEGDEGEEESHVERLSRSLALRPHLEGGNTVSKRGEERLFKVGVNSNHESSSSSSSVYVQFWTLFF